MSHQSPRAGWATCDITPPLGLPMGGRGARFSPGEQILDPLLAQATVLQDPQGRRAVLLSVDLVELPAHVLEPLTQAIASMAAAPPERVIINASHTHSGPMMGLWRYATDKPCPPDLQTYAQGLHDTLLQLVNEAMQRLTPVKVTWRMGSTNIGINRRRLADGQCLMQPNADGPYDSRLWVLEIQSAADRARRCVLFANACHPVMVYGYAWNAISAEWPGQARAALQQSLGASTHAQFFQGFAGNLRPRILADETTNTFRKATPADVRQVGCAVADQVVNTLAQAGDDITLDLQGRQRAFLAHRAEPPGASHWQSLMDSPQEHLRESAHYWATRTAPGGIPPFPATPWAIGLLQLDALHAIAWMGGEPVIEWRSIIEQALPGLQLTTWGYTHHHNGYLAVDELLPQGGYEVTSAYLGNQSPSPFIAGLDDAAARVFEQMARDITSSAGHPSH